MGSLNIAKCLNSSSIHSESMTAALYLCLLAFHQASLAPQYVDQTNQELSGNQLEVFEDSQVEEVDSAHTVKNEAGYTAPDDYQEASVGKLNSVATTEVDNVFENCADYTASQGYECVPYFQCNNGTIITDGEGLIDIRNGFGILSPEDSKCPGFLDVCCKGDGGSPLVCASKEDPFTYVQAGVVAWGIGCGEDATPGVYASVSKAVCWIDYAMSCHQGRTSGDFSSYWGHSHQCQAWMDGELNRLNKEVLAMQGVESLTGRRRAKVLATGVKAQNTLNHYSQCSISWTLSNFGRETDSLTSSGGYSDPHPGPPG